MDGRGAIVAMAFGDDSMSVSKDGGATFQDVPRPDATYAGQGGTGRDDTLSTSPDGRLWFTTLVTLPIPVALGAGASTTQFAIQVASSNDSGGTWDPNVMLPLDRNALVPDRPWLGFGDDGAVYVASNGGPAGIVVARSDDGGRTFGPFVVAIPGTAGNTGQMSPLATHGRSVFLAYGLPDGAVGLAQSDDGGDSFVQRVAIQATKAGTSVIKFPSLARFGDELYLAWGNDDGAQVGIPVLPGPIYVAASTDVGKTWTTPVEVGKGGTCAVPWVLASSAGVDVFWFAAADGPGLHWSRNGPRDLRSWTSALLSGPVKADPSAPELACPNLPSANTDFAHGALLGKGIVAPYGSFGEHILHVAIATP